MRRWHEAARHFRYSYVVMLELGRGDKAAAVVQELVPVLYKLQAYREAEHLLRWALGAVAEGKVPAAARGPLTEQLAETLFRSGQSAAAVPLYEDVVRTLDGSGRRTACQLATALGNLALAYAVAGEPARAPALLTRALAVADERCPAGVPAAHMATASYHTVRKRHGQRAEMRLATLTGGLLLPRLLTTARSTWASATLPGKRWTGRSTPGGRARTPRSQPRRS